jgi:serine protease Do
MTPTRRNGTGWRTWLCLGCLTCAALTAGPARGADELAAAGAHPADLQPGRASASGAARTLNWPTLAVATAGVAQGQDRGIQRLDAQQLAALDDKLPQLYARLAPSVVRLLNPGLVDERYGYAKGTTGGSGVIVSPAGEILTCGHGGFAPRSKVLVELADGRKVNATSLGRVKEPKNADKYYGVADFGMAVLDDKGPWPAAALGGPTGLERGELCFALGYPHVHKPGQPPLLRLGRVLAVQPHGMIRTTCRALWGDSGGPLFDLDGRVLGVLADGLPLDRVGSLYASVERFPKLRERLLAGEEIDLEKDLPQRPQWPKEQPGAWEPTAPLRRSLSQAHQSTVEIVSNGKVIALGLVVHPDGLVLTKRSELSGPGGPRRLACRLADGRLVQPRPLAEARAHDLTLLQLPAQGLPVATWAKGPPAVGQLLASLGPAPQPLHYGVVGALHVKNPATRGYLLIGGKPAPEGSTGMAFTKLLPSHLAIDEDLRRSLQAGDLITHLDDVPTPSAEEFARVRDQRTQAAHALPGDWLKLTVERKGKTQQVYLPLIDSPVQLWGRSRFLTEGIPSSARSLLGPCECWNLRMNGFPEVFSHDGAIYSNRCGGPVVDRSGHVIGINTARADPLQTFAIPGAVVQQVIAQLKAAP